MGHYLTGWVGEDEMDEEKQESPLEKIAGLIHSVASRWGTVFLIGAALLAIGAGSIASNLEVSQDFRRLLPQDSPSIQGLLKVDRAIGNQADLFVVIESPDRTQNIAFGNRMREELEQWRDEFRFVTFRRDTSLFEDNVLLYASLADLLELHDRVEDRIHEEVAASMALEGDDESPSDASGTEEEFFDKERMRGKALPSEYLETNEGELMVVIARPRFPNTDIERSRVLYENLTSLIGRLKAQEFDSSFTVTLQGSFAEQSRRQSELDASIVKGSFLAFFILFASIGLYFRSLLVVAWILIPLTFSIVCALAIAQLIYGYLNIVSAFIVAILLGIGIDFGIHLMTRYRDERRGGAKPKQAMAVAMTITGASTLAGALSTATSLLLLLFAEFQGLAQFGVIAGIGVLLSFGAATLLMPKLTLLFGEGKSLAKGHRVTPFPKAIPRKFTAIQTLVVVVGLSLAVYSLSTLTSLGFEYDLQKLGSIQSTPKKTSEKKSWRSALPSGATTAAMVVVTESTEETQFIQEQLSWLRASREFDQNPPKPWVPSRRVEEEEEEDPFEDDDPFGDDEKEDPFAKIRERAYKAPIASPEVVKVLDLYTAERVAVMKDRLESVTSLYSFVPKDQAEKLQIIEATRKAIDRKRGAFGPEFKETLAEWEKYLSVSRPISAQDVPEWVQVQMKDMDDRVDRFLVVKTLGAKADIENARDIRSAFQTLSTPTGDRPTAASFYVLPAVVDALHRDGPILFILAFSVLLLTGWFLFKDIQAALIVGFTVGIALLWLVGFMVTCGWKVDLFNLVAIPLIIGMGQDHALHMYHRIREEGVSKMARIVRETGGAIALTTWTTAIGFVGMLMAPHAGLQSLAQISLAGMILSSLSAVAFLPCIFLVMERFKRPDATPEN